MSSGKRRTLAPGDLLSFDVLSDAQISPDGGSVAYVVTRPDLDSNQYRSAVYLVPTEATGWSPAPRQLTTGTHRDTAPRWSPDGRTLAFVSDRSGTPQLYLLDLAGGEPRQLTSLGRGVGSPVWSPDGNRIAFTSSEGNGIDDETRAKPEGFIRHVTRLRYRFNESGYIDDRFQHVWVLDVPSGETRQLTWGEFDNVTPAWSPDSSRIAFVSNRKSEANVSFESQAYVISTAGDQVAGEGNDGAIQVSEGAETATAPVWSPDGEWVAFFGHRNGTRAGANNDVFITRPDGSGAARNLTESFDRSPGTTSFSDTWSPRDPAPLLWPQGDRGLFFTASDRGRVVLFRVGLDGNVELVQGGDRTMAYVTASADGQRLAYAAGTFTNPCNLYTRLSDGSGEKRLTDLNRELLDGLAIQEPEEMPFTSFDGGYEVDAWLIRPVGFEHGKQYPLVQIIHGGPHSIFGYVFFFDMQLWASQGWNVLFINPRGSQGYGEAFATCNLGDWGGGDWREQEMALDLAIERSGVDPDRLAVTGLSYGGFMTNWIVGQTGRYRVAASENGISNLVSFFTVADIGWYWLEQEMERGIWENVPWYMERSPISYVSRMNTPMLLLQAEADWRCPVEQGEQLYTALRARGVPAEMFRFPGESHTMLSSGKPQTRLVRREETLRWFQHYL